MDNSNKKPKRMDGLRNKKSFLWNDFRLAPLLSKVINLMDLRGSSEKNFSLSDYPDLKK
jgi:hypothetical protein